MNTEARVNSAAPDGADLHDARTGRVASVDVLRGLTVLLMIFVNDLGPASPAWLRHIEPSDADGMNLADVVFPAFLFLVGVSIPLSMENAKGVGAWKQCRHILLRTAALLLWGVIDLNHEAAAPLGPIPWMLLAFVCLPLAWATMPAERRRLWLTLKVLGILGLIILLVLFRRDPRPTDLPFYGHVEGWVWLRSKWWGILGLIGWAYLTVSLLYLLLGRRREWLMGAMGCLLLLHLAMNDRGLFDRVADKSLPGVARSVLEIAEHGWARLDSFIGLGNATGSLAAIAMAGCLLGSTLRRDSDVSSASARMAWAGTFLAGLLIAGALLDTFEGINKNAATPTWACWSAAITLATWMPLYLVIDVVGRRRWTSLVRPVGTSPLVAYLLHPFVVGIVGLTGLPVLGYTQSHRAWVVVGGSALMAAFIAAATASLSRLGLRVRL